METECTMAIRPYKCVCMFNKQGVPEVFSGWSNGTFTVRRQENGKILKDGSSGSSSSGVVLVVVVAVVQVVVAIVVVVVVVVVAVVVVALVVPVTLLCL